MLWQEVIRFKYLQVKMDREDGPRRLSRTIQLIQEKKMSAQFIPEFHSQFRSFFVFRISRCYKVFRSDHDLLFVNGIRFKINAEVFGGKNICIRVDCCIIQPAIQQG